MEAKAKNLVLFEHQVVIRQQLCTSPSISVIKQQELLVDGSFMQQDLIAYLESVVPLVIGSNSS